MNRFHTYYGHIGQDPDARIACEAHSNERQTKPYPVLYLGDARFFPTREQLVQIHDAITNYLVAQAIAEPLVVRAVEQVI